MRCQVRGAGCWVLGAMLGAVAVNPVFAQTTPAKKPRPAEFRGYFMGASEKTESPETFGATLGTEKLTLLGGGGEIVVKRRYILRGQVSQFTDTGTRVFVDSSRTVFPLNIPLDVRIRVVEFSGGYRFLVKPRWSAYAAAGSSRYTFTEEANDERDRARGGGWHLLGGIDVKPHKWVMVAGEVQWTKTDDIFSGGAAAALGESRLGGVRIGARIGIAY
jgi:hypothetical protein